MDPRQAIAEEIPRLRRYARALYHGDVAAADDLVQDALERALGRLHLFKTGTSMRAWLLTITRNVYVNQLRGRARRPVAADVAADAPGGGANPEHAPSDANKEALSHPAGQDDSLKVRDLNRALGHLAEDQREVVLLVGLEDLSYKETAEVLGIPVGTVMSRLSRGRNHLRRLMDGGVQAPRRNGLAKPAHLRSVT